MAYKISVVGLGQVGTAVAHALVTQGLARDLVVTSRNVDKARGDAMDLDHCGSLLPHVCNVEGGPVELTAGSKVVILAHSVPTVAAGRKKLAPGNGELFRETIPKLHELSPDAVFLLLSNPVDALTWHTIKLTGLPPGRVIGAGTIIDSARVRSMLSDRYGIHPDDLRVYVLGEHGESQFIAVSLASGGGVRFSEPEVVRAMFEAARRSPWEVFQLKGYTNFAIAQAAVLIARTVIFDELRTLPVSTMIDDYYGESDVCISLPCVVGRDGVKRVLYPDLPDDEAALFKKAVASVRDSIELLG